MKSKLGMKVVLTCWVVLGALMGLWAAKIHPCQGGVGEVRRAVEAFHTQFGALSEPLQMKVDRMEWNERTAPWWDLRTQFPHANEICELQSEVTEAFQRKIRSEKQAFARISSKIERHRGWMDGAKKRVERFRHVQSLRAQYRQLSIRLGEVERAIADRAYRDADQLLKSALRERTSLHYALRRTAKEYRRSDSMEQWKQWIEETLSEVEEGDFAVIVDKYRRRLFLVDHESVLEEYPAEIGKRGLASKFYEGDAATPEGRYRVVEKRDYGQTEYYRALLLDYPNGQDRVRFQLLSSEGKIPEGVGIGGLIEIHGDGGKGRDWTDGCIALENPHMDELWERIPLGTAVSIVGSSENWP